MDKKYKFIQATNEEVEAFNVEFRALLEKHSLIAETQPQIGRIGETGDFCLKGIMLLSKKVEDVEVVVEKAVESPYNETDKTVE